MWLKRKSQRKQRLQQSDARCLILPDDSPSASLLTESQGHDESSKTTRVHAKKRMWNSPFLGAASSPTNPRLPPCSGILQLSLSPQMNKMIGALCEKNLHFFFFAPKWRNKQSHPGQIVTVTSAIHAVRPAVAPRPLILKKIYQLSGQTAAHCSWTRPFKADSISNNHA